MEPIICSNCGLENSVDARFCARCDHPLGEHPSTEPVSQFDTPRARPAKDASESELDPSICPNCNHPNPPSRSICEQCQTPLREVVARAATPEELPERPGCITIFAILLILGAALVMALTLNSRETDPLIMTGSIVMALLIGVSSVVIVYGLWKQRNWARIGVVILLLLFSLVNVFAGLISLGPYGGFGLGALIVLLAFVGLPGLVIYWFARHKEYFY